MDDGGELTARKVEQILRDAGLSKSVARGIVAHGFKAIAPADADPEAGALAALSKLTAVLKGKSDE